MFKKTAGKSCRDAIRWREKFSLPLEIFFFSLAFLLTQFNFLHLQSIDNINSIFQFDTHYVFTGENMYHVR